MESTTAAVLLAVVLAMAAAAALYFRLRCGGARQHVNCADDGDSDGNGGDSDGSSGGDGGGVLDLRPLSEGDCVRSPKHRTHVRPGRKPARKPGASLYTRKRFSRLYLFNRWTEAEAYTRPVPSST